uniref:Homeobox domain-containing protein n=2 Tax=Rhizophora mucronata TaxID=61149 RepID=A0A2P2JMT8_RHIMU
METYFHGSSEIQAAAAAAGAAPADGIQTLLLMNPNYLSSYSDPTHHHQPQPPNMLFFNPTTTTTTAAAGNCSLNTANLPPAPPPSSHYHNHLVGIPLSGHGSNITLTANQETHNRPSSSHGVLPAGFQYNLWGTTDHNSVVTVAATSESGGAHDVVPSHIAFRRPPIMVSPARQGLSLSLSSQQVQVPAPFRPTSNEHEIQAMTISSTDDVRIAGNSPSSVSAVSNGGVSGMQSVSLGSKYLRAAQELLDEVVNVGNAIRNDFTDGAKEKMKMNKETIIGEGSSGGGPRGESSANGGAELNTTQKQELQMKKAKLINILDEVEQRYRQYHHQMQIVVSSFEQAAGSGAAKSYTSLALQTISKQFRCLKDAISAQIRATSKSLGEEDSLGVKVEGSSRLRYVDHQLHQQRALQELGMIQHHAWRPQRGLPERAVSVLRAWLFEHFLHPYPKDSDKHMLAKQTGLTRSQVSNWFINARVRLWKPMVEEMYTEEMKNQEKKGSDQENTSKNENKEAGSKSVAGIKSKTMQMDQLKAIQSKQDNPTNQNASTTEFSNSTNSISPIGGSIRTQSGFSHIRPSELEGFAQRSLKKQRSTSDMQNSTSSILSVDMDMKHGETNGEISVNLGRLTKDPYSLISSNTTNHGGGGFGAYAMGDPSRFNPEQLTPRFSSGNGAVSLTLGLPHCENVSLSGAQQSYLPNQNTQLGRRLPDIAGTSGEPEFCGINVSQNSHTSTGFENIDNQNRNRFAVQLLPDFVS